MSRRTAASPYAGRCARSGGGGRWRPYFVEVERGERRTGRNGRARFARFRASPQACFGGGERGRRGASRGGIGVARGGRRRGGGAAAGGRAVELGPVRVRFQGRGRVQREREEERGEHGARGALLVDATTEGGPGSEAHDGGTAAVKSLSPQGRRPFTKTPPPKFK